MRTCVRKGKHCGPKKETTNKPLKVLLMISFLGENRFREREKRQSGWERDSFLSGRPTFANFFSFLFLDAVLF